MKRIFVDAALLAIPNFGHDQQTADEIIDRVAHLAQLAEPGVPIELIASDKLEELLWGNNLAADFDNIDQFLVLLELNHVYSTRDIYRQYQYLIQTLQCTQCDVEVETFSNLDISPPLQGELYPAVLVQETERTFATICSMNEHLDGCFFGSSLNPDHHRTLEVNVEVLSASGPKSAHLPSTPFKSSSQVEVFEKIDDLFTLEHAFSAWETAETEDDLFFSIALGALAYRKQSGKSFNSKDVASFQIGTSFFESLKNNQCFGNGRFSHATWSLCSRIVGDCYNGHIGIMGRPDQEVRNFDKALGYRVHLTLAAAGMRLMYWQSPKGIEFANVGVKHELVIERGRPDGATRLDLSGCLQ